MIQYLDLHYPAEPTRELRGQIHRSGTRWAHLSLSLCVVTLACSFISLSFGLLTCKMGPGKASPEEGCREEERSMGR